MMTIKTRLFLGAALIAASTAAYAVDATSTTPATIAFGQTVEGELAVATPVCATEAPNVRTYGFTAEADTRIEITMHADDFDTVVEVGQIVDCQFVSLGSNDDGSGSEDGLNSRLVGRLTEAGSYVIRATSFGSGAAGKFHLSLNRLPAAHGGGVPTPIALTVGRRVESKLGSDDAMIEGGDTMPINIFASATEVAAAAADAAVGAGAPTTTAQLVTESGRPYHLYSLTAEAGQEFLIKLDSEEFDSFLEVGVNSPLGFSVAASNDDGGGEDDGLNSRLTVKFQSAGTLILRVSPLSADTGDYTLVVEPAPAPAAEHAHGQ
ncbi:MAG: hypothetical protein AABZ45_03050 [Pseudomonadota bacterium]